MAGKKLTEAVDEYMRLQISKRGGVLSHGTVQADNTVLRMFNRMVGDRVLANLTTQHVEDWFYGPGGVMDEHSTDSKRGGGKMLPPIAARTHNHYRSRLKVFFKWCVQRGYMKHDVMAQIEHIKPEKKVRQRPDPHILLQFLDVADNDRDRAYLACAVNTALRASEISAIRVGDVDLASGWLQVTILKTRDADHQPITADLDVELRRWLTQYAADLGRALEPDDFLFPRRKGGLISHYEQDEDGTRYRVRHPFEWVPKMQMKQTHQIVQKAMERLGLPTKNEGTHTIRRAVARAYFDAASKEKGDVAALRETSAFLHHSNTATTEIYLGLTPEKNARDNRLRGKPFLSALVDQSNVTPLRQVGGE